MTDSSTGGYLQPSSAAPAEDAALDAILQQLVVGVTGLSGTLVRPRWQPVMPKEPDTTVTWCAIGVTNIRPDENASTIHHPGTSTTGTDAYDEVRMQETIEVLCSFFGPSAYTTACQFRDGLFVAQNREALFSQGMGLVESGPLLQVPDLLNQTWRKRVDFPLTLRRMISRNYPVLNIIEAVGTVSEDYGRVEPFDTNNHH